MVSERVQKQIDRILDQAEDAIGASDWKRVRDLALSVLAVDSDNADAKAYVAMAEPHLGTAATQTVSSEAITASTGQAETLEDQANSDTPTSFANDRYQVSKFLGEGGKKRVYQAHDTLLDREVAFALIKTEGFDQTSKERISREAQAMGRLGVHPNIVAVLDLGQEDDGTPYMVTELMGGGDIEGLLEEAEENRLSLERTIEIGKAVCEGLEFAHARGIVHRDLKPGNVWLTEGGIAKIGDFGLAVMTDRSRLTREGMMVGTVSYMPPEQATGGDITPKADLYSLGAMLYEMVTGRPPFLGDDEIAIIGQHINTPPVAPTFLSSACPRPLEALIMRMLSKDPSERPESAQDVFNALDAIDLMARGETVERDANSLESLAGGVFVGRQAEMDQLKAALEDVLGGRGRLVTMVGEPGIGKTRTAEELATYAGLRGAKVLWGRCYEGGGAPPYWPWVQAIRSYVRDIDPDDLRRQMGSSASVVAEIVTDVKDRLPELQPPPQIDDPDSARFRLFDSITSFLKTASQSQPLVIVLDDLHWSDQPTLAFLEFIARELNQSRVLLICTYRDMELNRRHQLTITLGDLARDRLYDRVLLRGLTEGDIARFIEIAAGFEAPRELSATVHRHTEGNPLFVTEVVRDLVQSGELTEENVSGRSTWSVRIPEGVREVIGRRLDRLSDRANEIFTTAAVVGRQFSLDTLRALHGPAAMGDGTSDPVSDGQLLDVLDEALDSKIIEELTDEVGHFQFTHALIQETLTGELSSARKVRLHARIAETLEQLYGEDADEHAVELVPHFVEAELVLGGERSTHYSILAGEQALAMTAPQQALVHFEKALASVGDGPMDEHKARLFHGLGRARGSLATGRRSSQAAIDSLGEAFKFYADKGDLEKIEAIALEHIMRRATLDAVDLLESAIGYISPGTAASGRLHARLAWASGLRGDHEKANLALEEASAVARALDDPQLEVEVLLTRLRAAGVPRPDVVTALADIHSLLELLKSIDDPIIELVANNFGSNANYRLGRLNEALSHAERAWEIASGIGYRTGMTIACGAAFYATSSAGRWDDAEEWVQREEHMNESGGRAPGWSLFLRSLRQPIEDAESVRELIRSVDFDSAVPGNETVTTLSMLAELCHVLPLLDIKDEVKTARQIAADRYLQLSGDGVFGYGKVVSAGMLAIGLRDIVAAAEPYRLLSPLGSLETGFSTDRVAGLLALLLNNQDAASRHFEDALLFCRKSGCPKELAWTCSDYAEMLLDRDDASPSGEGSAREGDREKAIELQDEALAITQELGMRPLTERILARREILRA